MHRSRPNYHNYFPDGKAIPKDINPRVLGINVAKFGKLCIHSSAQHEWKFAYFWFCRNRKKKNAHSDVRLHHPWNSTPKSKTEEGWRCPFCNPRGAKKIARPAGKKATRSLVVIDLTGRWVSPVFTHPRGQSRYHSLSATLPQPSRFGAFTPGRFRAYWEYNTFARPLFLYPRFQAQHPVSRRVSKILF